MKQVKAEHLPQSYYCVEQEIRLRGIPASPGIAIAVGIVMSNEQSRQVSWKSIPENKRIEEKERYKNAVRYCVQELHSAYKIAEEQVGEVAAILETYEFILNDSSINESILKRIAEGFPAENAIIIEYDQQREAFTQARDTILRERAHDIDNVCDRLIQSMHQKTVDVTIGSENVVISSSIVPQDVILYNEKKVLGFITEVGGMSSHSCIMARSLAIPAVIGVKEATKIITPNSIVIVDGYEGIVISNPTKETLDTYFNKQREQDEIRKSLGSLAVLPAETIDGHTISLFVNIDSPDEVELAKTIGAEGVGLVRTEMLLLKLNNFPNEDEQYEWYNSIAERMYPQVVTFRAFDLGSDKYLHGMPHETNPALGLRGVRLLLQRVDLFKQQLSALLRASRYKNVRIMIPMITRVSEIEDVQKLIKEVQDDLKSKNIDYDAHIPLGMMIETPSSALLADQFASRVNFFSIGTNDLTQYTLAADRMSDLVSDVFDSFNPAVLRLIFMTITAAQKAGISVSVCGEFGSHSAATELLLGMGVDSLSVAPPLLPELKKRIRSSTLHHAKEVAELALNCIRPSDVRDKVAALRRQNLEV